jgi:glycosyltransferase involved in cell wall biosynthesis
MKLGIFTNFAFPHIGGSEIVIENVAHQLAENFGYSVRVYSFNQEVEEQGKWIRRIPCRRGEALISQLNENDRVWVYSDSFSEYGTLVRNLEKVRPQVTVALVGMYQMASNRQLYESCLRHKKKITFIEHFASKALEVCQNDGFYTKVIPNGVSLREFEENQVDFRRKYGIKGHLLLNVANYFYGKGQEYLPMIGHRVKEVGPLDFTMVSICRSVKYPFAETFRLATEKLFRDLDVPHLMLRDIPREDVVSAFRAADVFVFPSLKEVAPLVILESRASRTPWVASRVGDIEDQPGGTPVLFRKFDLRGYGVMESDQISHFASHIWHFLSSERMRAAAVREGSMDLEGRDWSEIAKMYDEVFRHE